MKNSRRSPRYCSPYAGGLFGHLVMVIFLVLLSGNAHAALPLGISSKDVGNVGRAGLASYSGGLYTVAGAGADIFGTSDAFRFVYGNFKGDGDVTARIDNVTEPNLLTRVGVMIRNSLGTSDANAFMFVHPTKGSAFQYRPTWGASTATTWLDTPSRDDSWNPPSPYRARYLRPAKWIKLTRVGSTVTAYTSDDGLCWNIRATQNMTFSPTTNYAGIALTSHTTTALANTTASHFTIKLGTPGPVNASCPRAKVDGEIAAPTTWVVRPRIATADTWDISSYDPNPEQRPVSCLEGGDLDRRRYRDDDPMCPADTLTAAWAQPGYAFNTGAWQRNQQGPFGDARLGPVGTAAAGSQLWLRKEITLSSTYPSQLDQLVFWGRWSNSVSIYVNGVLATNTYQSNLQDRYHYLGMNSRARAALKVGTNVIAARLDCAHNCGSLYADFGVALHPKLGIYPRNVTTVPGSVYAQIAQAFDDYTQEMGALGGTFAIRVGSSVVESRSLGYKDITLNTSLPADPILRLASVDKRVTEAVIVKLYREGRLNPDARVFCAGGVLSNVQYPPGKRWGAHVCEMTVDQLRLHSSGVSSIGGGQGWQDEAAYMFGRSSDQLTKHHLASILAGEDTAFVPGSKVEYSSNGYFLLRYIAEVLVPGKTLKDYLSDMGAAQGIVIAYERLEGRPANEGGYMIVGKETRARWFELEEYLALSASASGLTKFFNDYAPAYERQGNLFVGVSGGQGGSMDGTRSGASSDVNTKVARAEIWNSDLAGSNRYSDRTAVYSYGLNPGSCDPRGLSGQRFRINNAWASNAYVNIESGLQAGSIQSSWESAKWRFLPVLVNGTTYYIIQNAWQQDKALQVSGGTVISETYNPSSPSAHWKLEDHGTYFRIESRSVPGSFLNVEFGPLAINAYDDGMHSARWYLCN